MWQVCLLMRVAAALGARREALAASRPARRRSTVTFSSSMSAPSLCSALAIADSSAFLMMPAAFFCVKPGC
jgi:hypothetical protein